MPDIRPDSYVDGGETPRNVKQMMEHFYDTSYRSNVAYQQQAAIDKRYKVGDQRLWSFIYGDSQYNNSKQFFFNMIRRHLNMVTGYQRQNRKSTIMVPQAEGDDELADDYTACQLWSENRENAQEIYSQTFEGGTDVGMQLMHMYPDYTLDPISGDLGLDTVAYNNYIIDPYFRRNDLSDCNFLWRRRWVSKAGAKALLPGREKEIDRMQPKGVKDGKFPLQAELMNLDTNRLLAYDEFYYKDFREVEIILDPFTGEAVEWHDNINDQEGELEETLRQAPHLRVHKIQKPTVNLALTLNGDVMYDGPNLLKVDRYPFVPYICYYEPDMQNFSWRIQGIIRNLRDSQFLFNRRTVIELDILESQVNSGWIYPVDAVTDEKAFRQTGQGVVIPLKKGHLPNEIEKIQPPDVPASMIELSRSLGENITKISGVNEELLGSATDDKAGILSMLRQSAGLTTLQGIFDRMDLSQRILGGLRMEAIRKNFTKGKLKRILGRDPHEKFFLSDSSKFDTAVEEGKYSTTQRQLELQQLLHFRELGMPIPDQTILRASFIQNKKGLIQDVEEAAEAQAASQQQQAQAMEQEQQSKVMANFAKSKNDLAKSQEALASAAQKMSTIETSQAEAEHKRVEADLAIVKELIELEDMDMESLKRAITLSEVVKQHQEAQQNERSIQNA